MNTTSDVIGTKPGSAHSTRRFRRVSTCCRARMTPLSAPGHCQFGEVVCGWDDRRVDLGVRDNP
jgi:hypothetical protein